MIDPLLARAESAIEESLRLQRQRRIMRADSSYDIERLRTARLESAMLRAETKAIRDDRE